MCCALLTPLHVKTHFVYTIPRNDVPLLFKCSIMSVRRSDKQTLVAIVHISIVKKISEDRQSGILMPFGVKKQKSILAAYDIANILPNKKNIVCISIVYCP